MRALECERCFVSIGPRFRPIEREDHVGSPPSRRARASQSRRREPSDFDWSIMTGAMSLSATGEPAPRTGGGEGRAFQAQTGGAGRHGRGTRQLRCDRSWRADAVRPVGANIPVDARKTARWNDWYWRNSRFPRSAANGSKGTDMTRSPSPPVRAASCALPSSTALSTCGRSPPFRDIRPGRAKREISTTSLAPSQAG